MPQQSPFTRWSPRGRRLTRRAGVAITGGLAALATTGAIVASAAVPAFPDNIVVFPNRDFLGLEGFEGHVGDTATIEIRRAGQVVGSTTGEVAAGDHALEVNHPGGVCWGNGTDLKVTPDIRPGDVVEVKFDGAVVADTVVQDGYVDADTTLSGNTLTVTGHIAAGVNRSQVEQRIVNPDLTATDVGRRDIRAVPGGLVRSDKGGYSSNLEFPTATTFKATYVFDTSATAQMAASGGGERFMAWQEEDADANRQGLTIAEYKELGGPGMGGCPAGPTDVPAPEAGEAGVTRSQDKLSMRVDWVAATPVPGSATVTGYNVEAIAKTTVNGEQKILGRRTTATDTNVTIDELDPAETYTVEVRSITGDATAGTSMSKAFPMAAPDGSQPIDTSPDTTDPNIEATPAGGASADTAVEAGTVKLANTTGETGIEIYYTTDGSTPRNGDVPSPNATRQTAAGVTITGTTPTHLRWAGFDRAGNSHDGEAYYKAPPALAINPPENFRGTAQPGQVLLEWNAAPNAAVYAVQVYNAQGPMGTPRETAGTSMTIPNLTGGTPYQFGIVSKSSSGAASVESQKITVTPQAALERLTITRAQWRTGDFRVEGTSTAAATNPLSTVTIHRVTSTGGLGAAITGATGNLTAAVAPATGTTFAIRVRNGAPTTNPGRVIAKSSSGTLSAPITVTNG